MDEQQRYHMLNEITDAETELQRWRGELDSRVRLARQAGLSWADIGAFLGVSRQAAQQRFGS